MNVVNDFMYIVLRYKNIIPIVVLLGSVLFDDFTDLTEAEDQYEFLTGVAERLVSYLVILFICLMLIEVMY